MEALMASRISQRRGCHKIFKVRERERERERERGGEIDNCTMYVCALCVHTLTLTHTHTLSHVPQVQTIQSSDTMYFCSSIIFCDMP